jgi:hypothetical protein
MPPNRMLRQRGAQLLGLAALSLSAAAIDENSAENTVVGTVLGLTSGSTPTLTDDDGGRFKLVHTGGDYIVKAGATSLDYEAAATRHITIRETLGAAYNTPRDTVLAISVNDVVEITYTTFDASDNNAAITLSNGNLTAAKDGTTGHAYCLGVHGKAAAKLYFECHIDNIGSGAEGVQVGVAAVRCREAGGLAGLGNQAYGVASHVAGFTTGDVIGVHIDATANLAWYQKNGVTMSGTIDVSGGMDLSLLQKAFYPVVNLYRSGAQVTMNFGATAFAYTPAAGYSGWSVTAPAHSISNYGLLGIWIRSEGYFGQGFAEFLLRDTSGGATSTAGGTAVGTGENFGALANLLDGDTTTFWDHATSIGVQLQDPVWCGCNFGSAAARGTGFIAIRGRDGGAGGELQAPTRFTAFVGANALAGFVAWKVKGFTTPAWAGTTPGPIREFSLS